MLADHVIASAQAAGGRCAYIDAEHAKDPTYADAIGVEIEPHLLCQPDGGEAALEIADLVVRSGDVAVVVVDSVPREAIASP